MTNIITVHAIWDDEAQVWVATSEDVPGLVTEASTLERLADKLKILIPELLDANGISGGEEVPFHLLGEMNAVAHRQRA